MKFKCNPQSTQTTEGNFQFLLAEQGKTGFSLAILKNCLIYLRIVEYGQFHKTVKELYSKNSLP